MVNIESSVFCNMALYCLVVSNRSFEGTQANPMIVLENTPPPLPFHIISSSVFNNHRTISEIWGFYSSECVMFLYSEDVGSVLQRNIFYDLPDYTASHTEQIGIAASVLTSIRVKVLGSNFGAEYWQSRSRYFVLSLSLFGSAGVVPRLDHNHTHLNPFQFIR
jgi:hypothetical protein